MSYITTPTMIHSVRKLKTSNIKHAWLLLGELKVQHVIKWMKNWVLNHLNLKGEFEDHAK